MISPDTKTPAQEPADNRLRFDWHFSLDSNLVWGARTAEIKTSDGRVIFKQEGCEFPSSFSQQSVNIVVNKYFYGDQAGGNDPASGGRESSLYQVVHRIVTTIEHAGISQGVFAGAEAARIFSTELKALLYGQYGCFNSPVLFNVGLFHEYGIEGNSDGYYWDTDTRGDERSKRIAKGDAYRHPQASACFIQSVEDDMESILDLVKAEGMLFKHGSGTGSDLSPLRSTREKLSGGGTPSGPVSFFKVYDTVGGVIKSGGKTRRAARMQTLKVSHPDIMEFIEAKPQAEKMAHALIAAGYPADYNSVVYSSLPYQNTNVSVRVSDEFCAKWSGEDPDDNFQTLAVTNGTAIGNNGKTMPVYSAKEIGRKIAEGTHLCGDPGLQFHDTIQNWHTTPNSGPINSSNPCSEFLYIDDSACNLASINLLKFRNDDGNFDIEGFRQACKIFITAQEILVDLGGYPTKKICENSHNFRPLGLGYANLGALIMSYGLAYNSPEGRSLAGAITALMHGQANLQSIEMAKVLGPFNGFAVNREPMLKVMAMHREHCDEGIKEAHYLFDKSHPTYAIWREAAKSWDRVTQEGSNHGFRNAQATLLAPTGTIGFYMDCDTFGIEPETALVKYKLLAGGGNLKIVNKTIPLALKTMGFCPSDIKEVLAYIELHDTIEGCVPGKHGAFSEQELAVFDCAFKPDNGVRSIHYMGHIGMMAAAQPFLSGAISKTINAPEDITAEKIEQIYLAAWKAGLKAVAIYRDNSKGSQPLSTTKEKVKTEEPDNETVSPFIPDVSPQWRNVDEMSEKMLVVDSIPRHGVPAWDDSKTFAETIARLKNRPDGEAAVDEATAIFKSLLELPTAVAKANATAQQSEIDKSNPLLDKPIQSAQSKPHREKIPNERVSVCHKFRIGEHKGYLHAGFYPDGRIGEIFITMNNEGSTIAGLMNTIAAAVSMGLQYGVPLSDFVTKFSFTKFEPRGMTDDPDVKIAQSLVDFVFRKLGAKYPLGRLEWLAGGIRGLQGRIVLDESTATPGDPLIEISDLEEGLDVVAAHEGKAVVTKLPDHQPCGNCGNLAFRRGTCYSCDTCGTTSGCG